MRAGKAVSLLLVVLVVLIVAACESSDVAQVKEVTRIVEKPVEVEVTRLVEEGQEISEVEVTRIVEVPVTVEVERVVTATPTLPPPATNTPDAPELGSRENPYPVGAVAHLVQNEELEFEFSVIEVRRGDAAWDLVRNANMFNDAAEPGTEYYAVKVMVDYTGPDAGILSLGDPDIELVSQGRLYGWFDVSDACCIEPDFDFELLQGGHGEGWFAWPIPPDDNATLKLGPFFFSLSQ